jgi:hypothetical protein
MVKSCPAGVLKLPPSAVVPLTAMVSLRMKRWDDEKVRVTVPELLATLVMVEVTALVLGPH